MMKTSRGETVSELSVAERIVVAVAAWRACSAESSMYSDGSGSSSIATLTLSPNGRHCPLACAAAARHRLAETEFRFCEPNTSHLDQGGGSPGQVRISLQNSSSRPYMSNTHPMHSNPARDQYAPSTSRPALQLVPLLCPLVAA